MFSETSVITSYSDNYLLKYNFSVFTALVGVYTNNRDIQK